MELKENFKRLMLESYAFRKIKRMYEEDEMPFINIPLKIYGDACIEIAANIDKKITALPHLNKYVKNTVLTASVLRKIFDDNDDVKNPDDERRKTSLITLLVYAGIEEERWVSFLEGNYWEKQEEILKVVEGDWFVYRNEMSGDNLVVKKTLLRLGRNKLGRITASYKTLSSFLKYGSIRYTGNLISVRFSTKERSIEISAGMNDEIAKDCMMLSGILRSAINDEPFAKKCILVRAEVPVTEEEEENIYTVCHTGEKSPKFKENDLKTGSPDEDLIIRFLNQSNISLNAPPLHPASSAGLKSALTVPQKQKKFQGDYFAFIPKAYGEPGDLYGITLSIDHLDKVKEQIYHEEEPEKETHTYNGNCIVLNNTLRLSNTNPDEQKSEYLFRMDLAAKSAPYFEGITLDTDLDGFPCADACVAIRCSKLNWEFKPRVIKKDSPDYVALNEYFLKHLKKSIHHYFFELYPSVRYKGE